MAMSTKEMDAKPKNIATREDEQNILCSVTRTSLANALPSVEAATKTTLDIDEKREALALAVNGQCVKNSRDACSCYAADVSGPIPEDRDSCI